MLPLIAHNYVNKPKFLKFLLYHASIYSHFIIYFTHTGFTISITQPQFYKFPILMSNDILVMVFPLIVFLGDLFLNLLDPIPNIH